MFLIDYKDIKSLKIKGNKYNNIKNILKTVLKKHKRKKEVLKREVQKIQVLTKGIIEVLWIITKRIMDVNYIIEG